MRPCGFWEAFCVNILSTNFSMPVKIVCFLVCWFLNIRSEPPAILPKWRKVSFPVYHCLHSQHPVSCWVLLSITLSWFTLIFMPSCSRIQITRKNCQTCTRNTKPQNKWWVSTSCLSGYRRCLVMHCFHWLHRISCVVTKDNIALPLVSNPTPRKSLVMLLHFLVLSYSRQGK